MPIAEPFLQVDSPRSTEPRASLAPIFVGGAGRSGTTLVRVILDSHPNIACGPELKVLPIVCRLWQQFQTVFRPALQEHAINREDMNRLFRKMVGALLQKNRTRSGKPRAAEKTPGNVFVFESLHALFPESPLVHVIRDGRDVVCSLLTMNWLDAVTGKPVEYTRDARRAAAYWVSAVRAGRTAARKNPSLRARYFELRYEDVIRQPMPTLQRLVAFLGEPWDPRVLQFHRHARVDAGESSAVQVKRPLYDTAIGRWRRDLTPSDRVAVKEVAGSLLADLGYTTSEDW